MKAQVEELVSRRWSVPRGEVKVDVRPLNGGLESLVARASLAVPRGADLIVLGTSGWDAPCGATTQRVVREAECPVLTVPPSRSGAH